MTARSSSTTSFAAMIAVVNGPIRKEIGMERRHRRDGPVQSRQCHDRPRLQSRLDQRPGRLGAGRHLHGHARQLVQLQRDLPRGRGAQPVGAAATCRQGCKPTDSTVTMFFGGRYTHAGFGPRDTWQEKIQPLPDGAAITTAAADRDGPDRRAAVHRIAASTQGEADRLVRRELQACRRANTGTTSGSRR